MKHKSDDRRHQRESRRKGAPLVQQPESQPVPQPVTRPIHPEPDEPFPHRITR